MKNSRKNSNKLVNEFIKTDNKENQFKPISLKIHIANIH